MSGTSLVLFGAVQLLLGAGLFCVVAWLMLGDVDSGEEGNDADSGGGGGGGGGGRTPRPWRPRPGHGRELRRPIRVPVTASRTRPRDRRPARPRQRV
jgi:hypothetical protein